MSDDRSLPPRPRGLRIGVVSVLVAFAFLIGLALAVALVRRQAEREELAAGVAAALPPAPASAGAAPTVPAVPVDAATLTVREAVLAGQIAALEARTASLSADAQAAGGQATRAEALLAAIAARRLLDRGLGLGPLDMQLLARFGQSQPRAVAIVRAAGRQPVTLEDLRQGLDAIGPAVATGFGQGWWASTRQELANLIVLRRAGAPSSLPIDHLARARRLLQFDQVEAARAEVARLPGAADAANWTAAARRYVLARQALDALENSALTGPAPVIPPVTPLLP